MTYNTRVELTTLKEKLTEQQEKTEKKLQEHQKAIEVNNRRRIAALKRLKSE